ncbi:GNAT family N-acetyltransferase [Pseudonocardia benzenivorans]|uniref:GNAT family N-acetyltransferase n=1 Tax=Pseudonocardia benzenivorans TaxID=228005 RepID=A0ABW3VPC0_9PSEU
MMTAVTDVEITRVADEPGLRTWFDVGAAAAAHDRPADPPPSWAETRAELTRPWPRRVVEHWVARRDGEAVGALSLAMPTHDNVGSALVDGDVLPAHRRRGIGRALLARAAERARAHNRTRLILEVRRGGEGEALMRAVGARAALHDRRRRLPLPPADPAALARLEAEAVAAAPGYTVVGWDGPTPAEHLDDIARLSGRMSTDAPFDDLHWEPEAYDAARIREIDAALAVRGVTALVTAARVGATGPLVAFTVLLHRTEVPWHAGQGDTLVEPAHRGHRLGARVKLANLARLAATAPGVRAVDTWNADSNPWMVAINEAMGFRPYDAWTEWELDVEPATDP